MDNIVLLNFFNADGAIGANRLAGFAAVAIFTVARFYHRRAVNPYPIGPTDRGFGAFFHAEAATFAKLGKQIEFGLAAFRYFILKFSHFPYLLNPQD